MLGDATEGGLVFDRVKKNACRIPKLNIFQFLFEGRNNLFLLDVSIPLRSGVPGGGQFLMSQTSQLID